MSKDDTLLTAEQVGELLGKSGRTVRRLADRRLLPVAQRLPGLRGAYLFARADVEALIATDRAS